MTQAEPGYRRPDTSLLGDEHIRRYEETNGEVGHMWNGATALVLTTTGRKTGQPRKFALIYARDGNDYLVVASVGGGRKHPGWYLNVSANPELTIQVRDRLIPAGGRTARQLELRMAASGRNAHPRHLSAAAVLATGGPGPSSGARLSRDGGGLETALPARRGVR